MTRKIPAPAASETVKQIPRTAPQKRRSKFSSKLTRQQKEYVVLRLAAFDRPCAVVQGLREEFGVEVCRQAIQFYDPTKRSSRRLHEDWKSLFHATREALRKSSTNIGASYAAVRIRWRERMALESMDAGDFKLANLILDSIATEVGNAFGHRHEHEDFRPRVATIKITGRPEPAREVKAVERAGNPCDRDAGGPPLIPA